MPKRLRWYRERKPQAISDVLYIMLRVFEAHLRQASGASSQARFGAVSFTHRFGALLNRHVHYHYCIIDGCFDAAAAILEQVRIRVLVNSMSGSPD